MSTELFHKINGYLEGLSNLNSFFGVAYGHEYQFTETNVPIEEAVSHYNRTSNLSSHSDLVYLALEPVVNWQETLFELCAHWFFILYRYQNLQVKVTYVDEEGNDMPQTPAELIRALTQ